MLTRRRTSTSVNRKQLLENPMTSYYTAEVEFGMPAPNESPRKFYATAETPEEAKDLAVQYVPSAGSIHRTGVWSGSKSDRPDSGHEDGILISQ